jgi:hypothetical protein
VRHAYAGEKHLADCEENLETVKQWRHRIKHLIADFQNDIHRLSVLASSRTDSAQAFLSEKLEMLSHYINGLPSSKQAISLPIRNRK